MALLETKIYSALSGNATVAGKVGARIYPLVMPQDPTLPAITYQRTGAQQVNTLNGYADLEQAYIRISSWATRYDTAKELASDIHVTMDVATEFKGLLLDDSDGYDPNTGLFFVSQDYSCWNKTT